jgi:hypothetical protein
MEKKKKETYNYQKKSKYFHVHEVNPFFKKKIGKILWKQVFYKQVNKNLSVMAIDLINQYREENTTSNYYLIKNYIKSLCNLIYKKS